MARDTALDHPAELEEEDEFNRWPFSKRLADTIVGFDGSQGAPVLGLFGTWGSGKTTVLNFVRAALKIKYSRRVAVFQFNPWLFRDTDSLLQEFFSGLAATVEATLPKIGKTAGELMTRYGGAFRAVPLVGGGVADVIQNLGKEFSADSTHAQRDRLTKIMGSAERKVIVLIDDLDRLDRDEIMTMLKIVRLAANFPNVIYLLAFDEERVGRVAGQAYGELSDGRQFLGKIIQYPFSLPAISPQKLADYVVNHARTACDAVEIEIDTNTWNEFDKFCYDTLLARLNTPRQAIRYSNALRFALPMLKGEVDAFDQMIVEATRILFPDLYSLLAQKRSFDHNSSDELISDMAFRNPNISPQDKQAAQRIVKVLLRSNRNPDKPISDPRYHYRYFSYAVEPGDVSDAELENIIQIAGEETQDAIENALRRLAHDRLAVLVNRLSSKIDSLDLRKADNLVIALAKSGDYIPAERPLHDQSLASEVALLIARLANHYMVLRHHFNTFVTSAALQHATPLPLALLIYRKLQDVVAQEKQNNSMVGESEVNLFDHDWVGARALLKQRIKNSAEEEPPYHSCKKIDALRLLQFWYSTDPADEKLWLEGRLKDHPEEADALLSIFPDQPVSYQYITELASSTIIAEALNVHWGAALTGPAEYTPELEAARQFLDIHRRRTESSETRPLAGT